MILMPMVNGKAMRAGAGHGVGERERTNETDIMFCGDGSHAETI